MRRKVAAEGRATKRRLNRYEYEETLRDLLAMPYLEVKAFLPEDSESQGFNKIGDALGRFPCANGSLLSGRRVRIAPGDCAPSREARDKTTRYYTWEEREFFGKIKLEGPLNRRTFPLVWTRSAAGHHGRTEPPHKENHRSGAA